MTRRTQRRRELGDEQNSATEEFNDKGIAGTPNRTRRETFCRIGRLRGTGREESEEDREKGEMHHSCTGSWEWRSAFGPSGKEQLLGAILPVDRRRARSACSEKGCDGRHRIHRAPRHKYYCDLARRAQLRLGRIGSRAQS